jgi:aspartyl-tRNA(Asn)/glutamyl-tRNA(Gln) amidotransferase subunit B
MFRDLHRNPQIILNSTCCESPFAKIKKPTCLSPILPFLWLLPSPCYTEQAVATVPTTETNYEPVVGLEVHAQLLLRSKMFCGCAAKFVQTEPNTRVCPICLGMPGTLPVINKKAVEYVMMTGLALHCDIAESTKFDRKNYPYPDLMKGYQISQYDLPICNSGYLNIVSDGQTRRIGITRVHLEEDVARLQHRTNTSTHETYSLVNVNRAGIPLMEIVGDPDLRSPEEARQYLIKLRSILQYLNVSTGNMEEGSFRCDANVSIRPQGSSEFGTRVEIKNMNSFRAVYRALEYEVDRQKQLVKEGRRVVQETRGWVEEQGQTVSQRSKEYAHDYRYFPEPDLPPLIINRAWVEKLRSQLPELPDAKRDRLMREFGLQLYDASLLTTSKATADFFEVAVGQIPKDTSSIKRRAKSTSNWILGDLAGLLNADGKDISESKLGPAHLGQLIDLLEEQRINMPTAKMVLEESYKTGKDPSVIVDEKGLTQLTDRSIIDSDIEAAIAENPKAVKDYLDGKEAAFKFLVGQVMKATSGKANPTIVVDLTRQKLKYMKS